MLGTYSVFYISYIFPPNKPKGTFHKDYFGSRETYNFTGLIWILGRNSLIFNVYYDSLVTSSSNRILINKESKLYKKTFS